MLYMSNVFNFGVWLVSSVSDGALDTGDVASLAR